MGKPNYKQHSQKAIGFKMLSYTTDISYNSDFNTRNDENLFIDSQIEEYSYRKEEEEEEEELTGAELKGQLEKELSPLKTALTDLQYKIEHFKDGILDYNEAQTKDLFDESLDEGSDPISIFDCSYSVSSVWKNVDPTAYRCSLLDYINSMDENQLEQFSDYSEMQEELSELEEEIEDLEREILELGGDL